AIPGHWREYREKSRKKQSLLLGTFSKGDGVFEEAGDGDGADAARDRSEDRSDFGARRVCVAHDLAAEFARPGVDQNDAGGKHFWLDEPGRTSARDDEVRIF